MKTSQHVAPGVSGHHPGDDNDDSTRQRVASSILQNGPSTAAALAERLGLTAAAVRRHLDVLIEHGQLEAREQRTYGTRGRGRPAKIFVLTDVGRADFYSAYDALAIKAIEFLAESGGPDAVTRFAQAGIEATEAHYRELIETAGPETTPAAALAAALSGDGFVASTRPAGAGEQLCQQHCPVAHVAEQFPQLCEAETQAFSRLLGVHVQRLATIAHGDGVCTTHIPQNIKTLTAEPSPNTSRNPPKHPPNGSQIHLSKERPIS